MSEDLTNPLFRVLGSGKNYPRDGIRDLFASILIQTWRDAFSTDANYGNRSRRVQNTQLSRKFLTGNYSRDMFQLYCEALNIDPNRIINKALKQKWSKGLQPRYFNDERQIDEELSGISPCDRF